MGLGKQAKTLSRGQVDAMLAYLSTTRPRAELPHLPAFGQSRTEGQGDSEAYPRMTNDSQGDIARVIALQDLQGPIRSSRPTKRRCSRGFDRVSSNRSARRPSRDLHRAITGDLGPGHRQHVPALVPAPRLRWVLKSQRKEDVHHQRGAEDLDGRRVAEGRTGTGRSTSSIAVMLFYRFPGAAWSRSNYPSMPRLDCRLRSLR